jgi:hypothetical protein
MLQKLLQLGIGASGLLNKTIPSMGKVSTWASQRALNSKVVRQLLSVVIVTSMITIMITTLGALYLVYMGKIDAVAGVLLGGIFTFFGSLMAIAIPALTNATQTTAEPAVVPPAANDNPQ